MESELLGAVGEVFGVGRKRQRGGGENAEFGRETPHSENRRVRHPIGHEEIIQ
jgi:hypothetical protein